MIHANSAKFFATHPGKKEFWFTPDGQHFFTQEGADAHAITLKRKDKKHTVEHVTREEVEGGGAPAPKEGPTAKELAEIALEKAKNKVVLLESKVGTLTTARDEAKAEKEGLPADAKPATVNSKTKALEKAEGKLEVAIADLETAKEQVTSAEEAIAILTEAE